MSEALQSIDAITMFVADREHAKSFYESVFDAQLVYEDEDAVAFEFQSVVVNLLVTRAAHELIRPAAVGGEGAGARFQLTIGVDDTDAVCDKLARRGVDLLNGPIDRPWGVRTAAFADPDGHIWEIAAKIPS